MINEDTKIELEKIKKLLDTNIISEKEYNILKEEILFKRNSKKENFNSKPKFEFVKSSETKTYYDSNKQSSNNFYSYIIIVCIVIGFLVWNSNDNSDDIQSESDIISTTETLSVETDSYVSTTICKICGNEFSGDGYDKIDGIYQKNTNIQTELCSSTCARQEEKNIEDKYDNILKKNGYKSSKYFSIDNSDKLNVGKDGRIYESNPCSLCNGTGIESGRNIMTGEVEGRICPMCDGKGVRSY